MKKVEKSYSILKKLQLDNGLFLASTSSDYSYVWLRDSFYMSLPFIDKTCGTFEKVYHRILDLFIEYEWKLDIHTKKKPELWYEFIHARYSAQDVKEIHDHKWGHAQNDAIGAILWGIGESIKYGREVIRNAKDREIVQKLVWYLETLEYWNHDDSGMWEEIREVRSSSIAACVAGLRKVQGMVNVPRDLIKKGMIALYALFPRETETRNADLAQLSLVYPYNVFGLFGGDLSEAVLENVENNLVRERGVIRYKGDSYYSTLEEQHGRGLSRKFYEGEEAEWCFGFGFLSLGYSALGNLEKAKYYLDKLESTILDDGSIPELYYSKTNKYNVNTPLGWSSAMHILAAEKIVEKLSLTNK
jgi:phosphorylase kinase alpha/beta subunit